MSRLPMIVVAVVIVIGACSTSGDSMGTPIDCDADERGRLILFAQAVPTASAIPCLEDLPAGWLVKSIETRSGEALVVFENDTHDVDASATLTETCSVLGVGVATEVVGVVGHQTAGGVALVFDGGCFDLEIPEVVGADETAELLDAIGHVTRDELRLSTGWTL